MKSIEQEYADARPKSRALYERARQSMPSGVAHDGRAIGPFPFYVERADGPRKWTSTATRTSTAGAATAR